MPTYIAQRFLAFVVTLLCVSVAVFLLLDVLPGNAAEVLMGPDASPDAVAAMARQLGLDRPAWERYLGWITGLLHGDMGTSAAYGSPVHELVLERLAVTVPLALMAMALSCAVALAAGIYAAARHHRGGDFAVMALAQCGIAIPNFWLAILLILLFSVQLHWFAAGGFPGWDDGAWQAARSLLLPAVSLAAVQAAILSRVTRSALLDVLREDYVRTARAKGLSPRLVLWRHALRNALIPVLTVAGLQFAELLAGTIVVENVFTLPGVGRLIFQSIANRDLVVVRNCVMLIAAMAVLLNFAIDLLYGAIDPRVRDPAR